MPFLDTQPAPLTNMDELDPFAEFRVTDARDVTALMRELNDSGTPIQLSAPGGASLRTVVWSVDASADRLSFRAEPDDPQLQTLIEEDESTAVAYLDAVKLQFELQDLVLVRGERASAMQSRMPRWVYRFQRRQAYRVRTLIRSTPTAVARHPGMPEMTLQLRVLDVSIGGCALLLPDDVPPLMAGSVLHGVRLTLDADTRFLTTLVLQHVTSIQHQGLGVRLGCEITNLDGDAQRALQRYIDQTQKRRRLLSLG